MTASSAVTGPTPEAPAAVPGSGNATSTGTPQQDEQRVDEPGWRRRPTAVPGGAPTGARTRVNPRDNARLEQSKQRENETADILAGHGYQVRQNPNKQQVAQARAVTGDVGKPNKNPDYLIEGHVFDCYAPTEDRSVRGIWSGVAEKIDEGQTQRVVLDLRPWRGEISDLRDQFGTWPIRGLKELIAVTPSRGITQILPSH